MKAYRITVVIETFNNEEELLNPELDSIRDLTGYSVSTDYGKAQTIMSNALAQLDVDPLHGPDWNG